MSRSDFVFFRQACYFMIVTVSLWGVVYLFLTIFSCKPVSGFWHLEQPSKCILFGSWALDEKLGSFISQAASNMAIDIVIFLMPIFLFQSLELSRKAKYGLMGVFSIGAV